MSVLVGYRKMEGWTKALPFYRFKCKKHGWVESYPMGFEENLYCPKCIEEWGNK